MRRPLALVAACCAVVAPLAAQDSGWRLIETQDEFSGAHDRRLILRARQLPQRTHRQSPDAYKGASLILACGERLPADSGRTLLFYGGLHLEPFGGREEAYVEFRFSHQPRRMSQYWLLFDYGESVMVPDRSPTGRHLAFIGSEGQPYYSRRFLTDLLSADTLSISYRALGRAAQVVEFDVHGLAAALRQLTECAWPELAQ
jgi:hypothetical protein